MNILNIPLPTKVKVITPNKDYLLNILEHQRIVKENLLTVLFFSFREFPLKKFCSQSILKSHFSMFFWTDGDRTHDPYPVKMNQFFLSCFVHKMNL
ncbi:hypothetical protein SAMN04487895_10324 [Paenibacillus sophorae]|uniref:Uncharacterized protein n=1 Tax=Paenibacillus sophorae TaxID=1333845 RepID=A0A1H8JIS7_9BACL|nr:hypothetical protein SAMN04487895_10324 [Paenibacillus sophorae]